MQFFDLFQPYTEFFNWKNLVVSIVNFIVVAICLIKLIVYGEPVVDRSQSKSMEMEKLKQTTEQSFRNGDITAAVLGYSRQLQRYGIYLPPAASITWFECLTYTTWQVIRMIIYRMPFGLWLSHKIGGLFCSDVIRAQAMSTYKEIGWILHRLNQIDLMESQRQRPDACLTKRRQIYGLMVTLYAVNMCETADSLMYTKEMVEVYLAAALRIKSINNLRLLSSYYLRKAKFYHLLGTTQNPKFDWIFSDHGYEFVSKWKSMFNYNVQNRDDNITMIGTNATNYEPISQIQQQYCKHLLIRSLETLLGFQKASIAKNQNHQSQETHVTKVRLFTKQLEDTISDHTDFGDDSNFATISWITKIITSASKWMLNELDDFDELYKQIDEYPQRLRSSKSKEKALMKSLYVVFIAKREFINRSRTNSMTDGKLRLIVNRCNIASFLFQNYLTYNRSQNISPNPLLRLIQILTCDWLLELRTECWELMLNKATDATDTIENDEGISEPYAPRISQLELYQMDLKNLYLIFDTKQMGQSRINLYEAIYRLMAGAVPHETHRLLERNIMLLRQSKSNLICVVGSKNHIDDYYECGERERAQSMIFACKYLQAHVGIERAGLLTQAATIFKQIGDIIKTNECYHLLNAVAVNGEINTP